MENPVFIAGMGEIGSVLARAFLKTGSTVSPVLRHSNLQTLSSAAPNPDALIIAVGESDLQPLLASLPDTWKSRVVLLQNELLPQDWQQHQLVDPTIMSVWFEKKPGQDVKVVIPSIAFGPLAARLANALQSLNIPVRAVHSDAELLFELVVKNLYILTSNIAGLKTGGNVSELWEQHRDLAQRVASEVLAIQEKLCNTEFNEAALIKAMLDAFNGDPDHQCMGRSAPARLQRALMQAEIFNLNTPTLLEIQAELSAS